MSSRAGALYGVLLVALAFPIAAAQDDAGTGGDAPNDGYAAAQLVPGHYHGSLNASEGDTRDWYSVVVPAGKVLHMNFHRAVGYSYPAAYSSTGQGLGYWNWNYATSSEYIDLVPPTSTIYLEASTYDSAAEYDIDISFTDAADLALTTLVVHDPAAPGDDGSFDVAVTNVGPITAPVRITITGDQGDATRVIADRSVGSLAPGESKSYVIGWDTTGEIGGVTIKAIVSTTFDSDASNDQASATTHVIVDSSTGVDALNWQVPNGGLPVLGRPVWAGSFYGEGPYGHNFGVDLAVETFSLFYSRDGWVMPCLGVTCARLP